ncbi:hypothetical protein BDV59DRAFT_108827 [Aspergillus ambiguus]|uniref:uncharacterized protein n=1 Tax=Aspergillus ambiguus TaxID=176160 RepID=UPI003CCCFB55
MLVSWEQHTLSSPQPRVAMCGDKQTSYPYLDPPSLYWSWRHLGFSLIRLPVAWGHIQTKLGGPLNETTLAGLDNLVDIITGNGSTVILDLHNYARYDCAVIGLPLLNLPGAPQSVTDDQFSDVWASSALQKQSQGHLRTDE